MIKTGDKTINEDRINTFKSVIARRQFDIALVLDNIHDPHNIGAVLRSADSVGITDIYIIYNRDNHKYRGRKLGKSTSSGAYKWLDIKVYDDTKECMELVKSRHRNIYATHMNSDSHSIYECDFSQSCAIIFGNEQQGISSECYKYATQNIQIPMLGFTKSLNISVACAVTLYELARQRMEKKLYEHEFCNTNPQHKNAYQQHIDTQNVYQMKKLWSKYNGEIG